MPDTPSTTAPSVLTSDSIIHIDYGPPVADGRRRRRHRLRVRSIFAALGVRVTLIDKRQRLLSFVDSEITDMLAYHLRENGSRCGWRGGGSGMELIPIVRRGCVAPRER